MKKLQNISGGVFILVSLFVFGMQQSLRAQPLLEESIANLYAACLFEGLQENNPFSQAASLARQSFAPGIAGFIESNLATIPLTPPTLVAEFSEQGIVEVVTGLTPIYTESSASVGKGLFFAGANVSHFDLSHIRGKDLNALSFAFQQNGGGDRIQVNMPMNISATVFTIHGTYGVTDRFDIGFALPIVRLAVDNVNTTFTVEGDNTGCNYGTDEQVNLNCDGGGNRSISPVLFQFAPDPSEQQTFLETVALRMKYRFPVSVSTVRLGAVMDIRLPLRTSDNMLGSGNFGTRFTFISEYNPLSTFQPYINVGAQFWNGLTSNTVNFGTGFNQQLASNLFFSFDLMGKLALEPDAFLEPIGGALSTDTNVSASQEVLSLASIPAADRDHTLNAGLGFQFAFSTSIHAYGSALFALLDQGLQSTIVPTAGIAAHF